MRHPDHWTTEGVNSMRLVVPEPEHVKRDAALSFNFFGLIDCHQLLQRVERRMLRKILVIFHWTVHPGN